MKKYRFMIFVVAIIVVGITLIAVLQASKSSSISMEPVEGQDLVYKGNGDADNELLFLFDYACSWCSIWIDDVYPTIQTDYIDTGKLKFRSQAMVYVNEASLRLANLDQNIKKHAPETYDQIFHQIIGDTKLIESEGLNWGTDEYINDLIETYQLDQDLMTAVPELDSIQVSRTYTRALEIEFVPSLYINGIKLEDPFDLAEIERLIK